VIQPVTEMSNRMSPEGKGGRCVELITFQISCADRPEILEASNVWRPKGLPRLVMGQLYLYLVSEHLVL